MVIVFDQIGDAKHDIGDVKFSPGIFSSLASCSLLGYLIDYKSCQRTHIIFDYNCTKLYGMRKNSFHEELRWTKSMKINFD